MSYTIQKIKTNLQLLVLIIPLTLMWSCQDDPIIQDNNNNNDSGPTPYVLQIPSGFPKMDIPSDNPLTVEGIALGRRLFYDPILSADNTQACASCHAQQFGFTDNALQFSKGIDGLEGNRNAMAVINVGWYSSLFWDGRAESVEDQALAPVTNPVEMHNLWPNAMASLQAHPDYPELFRQAFSTTTIDSNLVVKAISQFERTLISGNSKFDRVLYKGEFFTDEEERGYDIFITERGDCFHCHGDILATDNLFHNNGLDETLTDLGLFNVTGNDRDKGKFKSPTLRNIELTAPYMHDGRFQTLEEVIDHYSEGVKKNSPNIDPLMKKKDQGGLHLTEQEKADLLAFLKTFTDRDFVNNAEFANPF